MNVWLKLLLYPLPAIAFIKAKSIVIGRYIFTIVGTLYVISLVRFNVFKAGKVVCWNRILLKCVHYGVIASSSVDVNTRVMDTVAGVAVTILLDHTSILTMGTWVRDSAGSGAAPRTDMSLET